MIKIELKSRNLTPESAEKFKNQVKYSNRMAEKVSLEPELNFLSVILSLMNFRSCLKTRLMEQHEPEHLRGVLHSWWWGEDSST